MKIHKMYHAWAKSVRFITIERTCAVSEMLTLKEVVLTDGSDIRAHHLLLTVVVHALVQMVTIANSIRGHGCLDLWHWS